LNGPKKQTATAIALTQSQTNRLGELPSQNLLAQPEHEVESDRGLKTWIIQGRRGGPAKR
jgi:hypothetical protein